MPESGGARSVGLSISWTWAAVSCGGLTVSKNKISNYVHIITIILCAQNYNYVHAIINYLHIRHTHTVVCQKTKLVIKLLDIFGIRCR